MTDMVEALIEETIETSAPPAKVFSLISDLTRMARWSPQVMKTFVRGGPVHRGTTALNINRRGVMVWPTRSEVVRFEPDREFAIRVKDNLTIWSFTLEPLPAGGTRIIQRREAPDGVSEVSRKVTERFLGGVGAFQDELRQGMRRTLERLKVEAEGS